ncbi:type I restriction endonuclease [Acinetobacter baumannii]
MTNQITIDHRDYNGRTSRFDVTLLVNGLPLVQIELKNAAWKSPKPLIKPNAIFVKPIGQGKGCLVLFSSL